jgi:hypothetical protein
VTLNVNSPSARLAREDRRMGTRLAAVRRAGFGPAPESGWLIVYLFPPRFRAPLSTKSDEFLAPAP